MDEMWYIDAMEEHETARLTPNQLVARNLREARLLRGLKQAEAGALIAKHLGEAWAKQANYSAAESGSISGQRIRKFTSDEILAFALVFDLPIAWFFLPPESHAEIVVGGDSGARLSAREMWVRLLGGPGTEEFNERLKELWRTFPDHLRTQVDREIAETYGAMMKGVIQQEFDAIDLSPNLLRRAADLLDSILDSTAQAAARATHIANRQPGDEDLPGVSADEEKGTA